MRVSSTFIPCNADMLHPHTLLIREERICWIIDELYGDVVTKSVSGLSHCHVEGLLVNFTLLQSKDIDSLLPNAMLPFQLDHLGFH